MIILLLHAMLYSTGETRMPCFMIRNFSTKSIQPLVVNMWDMMLVIGLLTANLPLKLQKKSASS